MKTNAHTNQQVVVIYPACVYFNNFVQRTRKISV